MPAGCSRSSPRRRAFFILLPRQLGRFGCAGGEFASVCPLAAAILHLAGVHFSFCISAGMVVSTVTGRNLPPYARWPLSFFIIPACIFHLVSPPAWPFRLCRHGISPRVPAGRSRSLPRRRAYFILLPRRHGRLDGDGGEFASISAGCSRSSPCRRAYFIPFPRRHGRFDCAGMELAPVCPLVAAVLCPAGVHFHLVSPPAWSSRR